MHRRNQSGGAFGLLVLFALLAVCACAGTRARDDVLEPAMRGAWSGISEEVERGAVDARTTGAIDDAGLSRARTQARAIGTALGDTAIARPQVQVALAPWKLQLRPLADRGINAQVAAGEIGPGVAGSKRERLSQFSTAVDTYLAR